MVTQERTISQQLPHTATAACSTSTTSRPRMEKSITVSCQILWCLIRGRRRRRGRWLGRAVRREGGIAAGKAVINKMTWLIRPSLMDQCPRMTCLLSWWVIYRTSKRVTRKSSYSSRKSSRVRRRMWRRPMMRGVVAGLMLLRIVKISKRWSLNF